MEQPADDEAHQQLSPCEPLNIERDMPDVAAGQEDVVRLRQVHGDLGPGIARAHEEHSAARKLSGITVFVRVQLHDVGPELASERGYARLLIAGRRDHHLVGLICASGRFHVKATVHLAETVDAGARANRQVHVGGIALEVLRHLVLGRKCVFVGREAVAVEAVELRGSEKPERIPPLSPDIADAGGGLQNHMVDAFPLEVMANR